MKELVVISGKGGTGKTSLVASFAAISRGRSLLVDCDVDAANLHLLCEPRVVRQTTFTGGKTARIKPGMCIACGKCEELCRFDAVFFDGPGNGRIPKTFRVDPISCEGCGVCSYFCAENAIELTPTRSGRWFISETRFGTMIHATLDVAAENSGKLVTILRQAAQELAAEQQPDYILCDGAPGIGCPVIASLTGAQLALFVVEPTLSGIHDFRRVAQLARQLELSGLLVVNKADLNDQLTSQLEQTAAELHVQSVGRIPFDPAVVQMQINHKPITESPNSPAARAIQLIWKQVEQRLRYGFEHPTVPRTSNTDKLLPKFQRPTEAGQRGPER